MFSLLLCGAGLLPGGRSSRIFSFDEPIIRVSDFQNVLCEEEGIPVALQRLTQHGRPLDLDSNAEIILEHENGGTLAIVYLNFRLLGGKGGFGSLLRGTGTRVGQKKTSNFDACRDLTGRRLREINNEKKLAEWYEKQAERAQRREEQRQRASENSSERRTQAKAEDRAHSASKNVLDRVEDALTEGIKASLSTNPRRKPSNKKRKQAQNAENNELNAPTTAAAAAASFSSALLSSFISTPSSSDSEDEEDKDEETEDEDDQQPPSKKRKHTPTNPDSRTEDGGLALASDTVHSSEKDHATAQHSAPSASTSTIFVSVPTDVSEEHTPATTRKRNKGKGKRKG